MRVFKQSVLGGIFLAGVMAFSAGTAEAKKSIRFWVAHNPGNTENNELIQNFADRVRERTKGEVDVRLELVDRESYRTRKGAANPAGEIAEPFTPVIRGVLKGEMEMSQVPVMRLAKWSPKLAVLETPFMFLSHDHAARIFDGPIGDGLREDVLRNTKKRVRGLGFTYSGGLRQIFVRKDIQSAQELRGLKMRKRDNPIETDYMSELGISFVPGLEFQDEFAKAWEKGEVEADEAEFNRFKYYLEAFPREMASTKVVLDTNHSLYLTMVIINEKVFQGFSQEHRKIVQEEALRLAREERALSLDQERRTKEAMRKAGIKIMSMSKADMAKLESAAHKVQVRHKKELGALMAKIRKAGATQVSER